MIYLKFTQKVQEKSVCVHTRVCRREYAYSPDYPQIKSKEHDHQQKGELVSYRRLIKTSTHLY